MGMSIKQLGFVELSEFFKVFNHYSKVLKESKPEGIALLEVDCFISMR